MNVRAALPTLTVAALLLTGCTSEAVEPSPPSPTATADPSPAPEPSPTPTDGIQVHSDPEIGIVFQDVPDLTGDEAEVYNWIATYQKGFWQTLMNNEVSGMLTPITSAEVQARLGTMASDNAALGVSIGGSFHTRISDIVVTGDTATGIKCDDLREATFTTSEREWSPAEAGQDIPQRGTVELLRLDGGVWLITKVVEAGTC